jgi:hypothetical protein
MAVNLGSNSMSRAYLGGFEVAQIFLGNNLVYPTIPSASFGSGFSLRSLGAEPVVGSGSNNFYAFGDLGTYKGTLNTTRLAKMDLVGTADPIFAANITTSFAVATWGPNAIYDFVQDEAGKMYASSEAGKIRRINVDGTIDTSFNIGSGFNIGNASFFLDVDTIIINIPRIVTGGITYKGQTYGNISRIGYDGSIQSAGYDYTSYFDGKEVFTKPIHKLTDNGYFLTNVENYRGEPVINKMLKLLPNLEKDTSYTAPFAINPITGLTRLSNGKYFTQDESNATRRLNDDGSFDNTFTTVTVTSNAIKRVVELLDGKIAILGNFGSVNGNANYKQVAILNADGSLNSTFRTNVGFAGGDTIIYGIIENSGYYYILGSFTSYRGVTANNIIRVNANGNIA